MESTHLIEVEKETVIEYYGRESTIEERFSRRRTTSLFPDSDDTQGAPRIPITVKDLSSRRGKPPGNRVGVKGNGLKAAL